jgi:ATP-dependent helicase/DNAse subunit B
MPLELIQGPPNSGRAGLVRRALLESLEREPVLVVPTVDDVYWFERELCSQGPLVGASVMTFAGLFSAVATAGGAPPVGELTRAQRLGAVRAAIEGGLPGLGPLRGSARRPGFAPAFETLLDELQAAGLEPAAVEAAAATLEGSAYLGDVAALFSGYAAVRDGLGACDRHGIAREAIERLEAGGSFWSRPVLLYGLDDLTANQRDLIAALSAEVEVTIAIPYERGNPTLEERTAPLREALGRIGGSVAVETAADPGNTDSALLFGLERAFGRRDEDVPIKADESLVVLRSAGERVEAESIAAEVARLLAAETDPEQVAIVLRDPARRGPLIASVLESCGIPTALEAELPISRTAVGGALLSLLEAELGSRRAADLLAYMRGPSALSRRRVDWFEALLRQERILDAEDALAAWERRYEQLPPAVARLRSAAADPVELAETVASLATEMGAQAGGELEPRAAGAIANALSERAEIEGLTPGARGLPQELGSIAVRVWTGPVEDRVRIADPYRLRAGRFDHVFVASLQEGEFPRVGRPVDPFLSEEQRGALGLPPRRDTEAEERYLFHAALALPRRRLYLSYRDSDENGVAESPSPFVDDVRRLLRAGGDDGDPLAPLTRQRDLATVVQPLGDAPSESDLARAIAAGGPGEDVPGLLERAGASGPAGKRIAARIASAARAEAATRAPGPLSNPTVIAALGEVPAYGGTTLEGFDVCSYRWFVSHELSPQPLDPLPDPLVQGSLMHAVLEALYRERPGGDSMPRPDSLGVWRRRSSELVAEIAAKRGLGRHPVERAMRRRVAGLLSRFLGEEAARRTAGFEPWLLEAGFGEDEEAQRPALRLDGWALHGAVDRVDRAPDGRALVIDYKLAGSVTSREKLEEEAKLQLQLYLTALAELWDAEPVAGIYHPLRGSSQRRPRGIVLDEAAADLAPYEISSTDLVSREEFERMLADARRRAGEIVARMRTGRIERDPGPRRGLRGHDVCPSFCDFATICRRDRAPEEPAADEDEEERT